MLILTKNGVSIGNNYENKEMIDSNRD